MKQAVTDMSQNIQQLTALGATWAAKTRGLVSGFRQRDLTSGTLGLCGGEKRVLCLMPINVPAGKKKDTR